MQENENDEKKVESVTPLGADSKKPDLDLNVAIEQEKEPKKSFAACFEESSTWNYWFY